MRLIDADELRLVKCGEYDNGKPINCVYEWAIKDAPTVNAIPVEWIKKKYNEADDMGMGIEDWSIKDCYGEMLAQWEKENEPNKKNTSQTD